MPTRKQRRRDAKLRRHEYEHVWVDADGNEVPADEAEAAAPPRTERRRDDLRPPARGSRTIQPPSWRRVGKRALVFGPLMFVVIMLVYQDQQSVHARVLLTLQMLLLFVPFSYLMDSLFYRAHRRRLARAEGAGTSGRR